jgi:hypothetical protein
MSGTASIYDEIKKSEHSKKREKLKLIVTILTTNLFVAMVCLNLRSPAPVAIVAPPAKIIHPHYKILVTPLTVLAEINEEKEIPVTLLNKARKILVQKAYLHEEIKTTELGSQPRFKIEIPEEEMLKLSAGNEEGMIAIPEIKILPQTKKQPSRASQYEINL